MLEARDITFAHPGQHPLYEGFSRAVEPGERVALVAPSGFGKTTLCQMLAGYLRPTSGQILLDGQPLPVHGICPVQMVWQHPEIAVDPRMRMAATLAEAGVGRADGRRRGHGRLHSIDDPALAPEHARLLRELGIRDEWLSRFPHELSGGELQRFCIARALATRPRYLVADEISTMLDAVTQAHIWRVLLDEVERRNIGMVFVSHSPALTRRIATRVVELAN